ncbi:MAG TPA: hypothetical protein PLH56_02040 [Candidatus Omnitrophota bacterium]|nr:hypothetical protein [Candidatus Omnitrophota bacterium]HPN88099.1 hypothetical protein [Candidatus Omnitrophota bacterium]
MKNPNKTFIVLLFFSCVLITAVIIENAYLTNKKTNAIIMATTPDTKQFNEEDRTLTEIKNKLRNAGIVPREAKYWEKIN